MTNSDLCLFKVVSPRFAEPRYFDDKMVAKNVRDEGDEKRVVMRGPDHWRGESFNVSKLTRSRKREDW